MKKAIQAFFIWFLVAVLAIAAPPLTFNKVYVTYLLKVYLDLKILQGKTAKEFEKARSQLHENIRDRCAKAGIRIFAPHYQADPTNYGSAVRN